MTDAATILHPLPDERAIDRPARDAVRDHFDRIAERRPRFRKRNRYYYQQTLRFLRGMIPPGSRVLEVGCADGHILAALEPSEGVGIDISPRMVAAARAAAAERGDTHLSFHEADIESVTFDRTFDYIVLSDTLSNLLDIQRALDNLRSACTSETRIIIHYHNVLWEPMLRFGEAVGLKLPQPRNNWLSFSDMRHFFTLADFELVKFERRILMPKYIPLLSAAANRYLAPLPLVNHLCLTNIFIARMLPKQDQKPLSTTILIPCRNEKGNIQPAIDRLPDFTPARTSSSSPSRAGARATRCATAWPTPPATC